MFQYENEKRPPSSSSCESRATAMTDWSRSNPSESRSYPNESRTHPNGSRVESSENREYLNASRLGTNENRVYPSGSRRDSSESRTYPNGSRVNPSVERARRPLPPRPIVCERMPTKTTVPLKVWIIASASCFAVCAALVLATVVITKWGAESTYSTREVFSEHSDPIYANYYHQKAMAKAEESTTELGTISEEIDNEIQIPVLEKLSIFKNVVANRNRNNDLTNKAQLHPAHDIMHHNERKIEKKDKAKLPDSLNEVDLTKVTIDEANEKIINNIKELHTIEENEKIIDEFENIKSDFDVNDKILQDLNIKLPEFKPILPILPKKQETVDVKILTDIKLPEGYINDLKNNDYEEYYNDENFYDDYMQSNTMTSYLIEKVQELHDWITADPDFDKVKNTTKVVGKNEFGNLLKALNESLLEGNVTIVMNKLKDIYFGDNYTVLNSSRKVILTNKTDLLSFGILTLDVMLLHNIQLMAWENQETARTKMLKDPDVFAFNALFMDPTKVEAKQNEILHNTFSKRQNLRQQDLEDFNLGANLFENVVQVGVSAARAAIHLGRAYKNTKNIINQLSNRDVATIQSQISRNIDGNTHALNHLQTSFNDSSSAASEDGSFYTELDCVWLLYCRNLVATSKLNAPFGTMARINGMALRMLAGELSADRALDTMLYEALTGWSELRCNDMFPRCSKVDAASVVLESILQPLKKSQSGNRARFNLPFL